MNLFYIIWNIIYEKHNLKNNIKKSVQSLNKYDIKISVNVIDKKKTITILYDIKCTI